MIIVESLKKFFSLSTMLKRNGVIDSCIVVFNAETLESGMWQNLANPQLAFHKNIFMGLVNKYHVGIIRNGNCLRSLRRRTSEVGNTSHSWTRRLGL